jgi:hypothetical protein
MSATRTFLGRCRECRRPNELPTKEGVERARDALDRATDQKTKDTVSLYGAAGEAIAILRMVAGCMDGLCIFCQPPPKWVQDARADEAKAATP